MSVQPNGSQIEIRIERGDLLEPSAMERECSIETRDKRCMSSGMIARRSNSSLLVMQRNKAFNSLICFKKF
jgi:hypothetical protein